MLRTSTGSEKLIEAFNSQPFLPLKELLKTFLGGSLDHHCSFCNATLTVVALACKVLGASRWGKPLALLKPFAWPIFVCGRVACTEQMVDKEKTWDLWSLDDHLRQVEGNQVLQAGATGSQALCSILYLPLSQVQEVPDQGVVQQGVPAVEQGEAQGVLSGDM